MLLTSLTALPLPKHSVDCIIAPLTIEAFAHREQPIDEMDRILKPMGHIGYCVLILLVYGGLQIY